MKYILIFLIVILTFGCETNAQTINIPDKILVKNINEKINIKGSKILIDNSINYKFIDEMKRFQKDSLNYFQIMELENQDYNKTIPKVISKINELEKQGGKIRVKKELKLGEYDAFIGLAPQGKESEQIVFAFGDESFTVLVMGVFQNNENERKEITNLILNLYYDKSININIEDNLFYTVDLSNSKFKLISTVSNMANYTLNGEEITDENIYNNNFVIGTMPEKINNFNLKKFSDNLIYKLENNMYEAKNIKIENKIENNYKEGEDEVRTVEVNGVFKNKNIYIYQYIKQTTNGIIFFIGSDNSKNKIHIEEYKEIAKKIKLK